MQAPSQPQPVSLRTRLAIAAGLSAAVWAVYAQTLGFALLSWDDHAILTRNEMLRSGLSGESLRWAFTSSVIGSWHPLTSLSYLLEFELYGLEPAGYHATSVALHHLNTLLLFGLLLSMTGRAAESGLVAALFALHPLHVESVAWVSERKDLLSTAFGLLCLMAYVGYARRPGAGRYLLCALLLVCSLLSKQMLVTLPLLMLLLDVWPLGRWGGVDSPGRAAAGAGAACPPRSRAFLLAEKVPLLALCAAASAVTLFFQQEIARELSVFQRGAHVIASYAFYLLKALWPTGLAAFYPHPYLPQTGGVPWTGWQLAGAVLLLAALSWAAFRLRARGHPWVGWLWFLVALLPVIGLVQVGRQGMADRYTYLPLIGPFATAVFGASELFAKRGVRGLRLAAGGAAALLALLGWLSWQQAGTWRDSEALYRHALGVEPRNAVFRFNLATLLHARGGLGEAAEHYEAALRIHPEHVGALAGLGLLRAAQGDPEAATARLRAALRAEPGNLRALLGLADLARAGDRRERAARLYRRALRLEPRNARALAGLAGLGAGREGPGAP